MFDRVFVNAIDVNGNALNLAVKDGLFAAVGARRPETDNGEIIDLKGHPVLPGFVDGHIHLDKSFVGVRWRPHRPATTLRERLAIEKQELAGARPIAERADALIRQAAPNGAAAVAAPPAERAIVRGGQFRDDSSRLRFKSQPGHHHGVAMSSTT
jgi:cytosine/adenosine deaminase-related metal-dependent hydrolase